MIAYGSGIRSIPSYCEHADEMAVEDAGFVDFRFGAIDRAEQLLEDHPFRFLADSHRAEGALQEGHDGGNSIARIARRRGQAQVNTSTGMSGKRLS